MPRRLLLAPHLPGLLAEQDHVLTRRQAFDAGHTSDSVQHQLATGQWRKLLPGVYLCASGHAARRQELLAGLLYSGPEAGLEGIAALRWHDATRRPDDQSVRVVVPADSTVRPRGFLRVRRTAAPYSVICGDPLRWVDPATAVMGAVGQAPSQRAATALLTEAVQRRVCAPGELLAAHGHVAKRFRGRADAALSYVMRDLHSAGEAQFHDLVATSLVLPPFEYNVRLRLPDGRIVIPDALIASARLVHETNGRAFHERADLFASMQERHDVMTAAGLTVLHNPPRRYAVAPATVLDEVERCFLRNQGLGLPPGVMIVPPVGL